MAVVANAFFFSSLNRKQLAVHLQAGNTKDHLHPGLSQAMRHFNVGLLVESSSKLDHCGDALAIVQRIQQCLDHTRVVGRAIKADLD